MATREAGKSAVLECGIGHRRSRGREEGLSASSLPSSNEFYFLPGKQRYPVLCDI